eukprot:m.1145929 g.1145929  ORF g.1145929 m.1145929 type:complete len:471 (+) comp24465_c0_seq56:278-1690(+)
MPLTLLTGPPGCGKTHIIERTLAILQDRSVATKGFITREVRNQVGGPSTASARRIGFDIVDVKSGSTGVLARVKGHADVKPGPVIGKYVVNVSEFEGVALASLSAACASANNTTGLYIVDEIGRMELLSTAFCTRVRELSAPSDERFVLATVAAKGDGLIEDCKGMSHATIHHVTTENRDALPQTLAAGILKWNRLSGATGGVCPTGKPTGVKTDAMAGAMGHHPLTVTEVPGGRPAMADETDTKTACCVIPYGKGVWDQIQHFRSVHDKQIIRWPPHCNLLFPFIPQEMFPYAMQVLQPQMLHIKPFTVALRTIGVFSRKGSHTLHVTPQTLDTSGHPRPPDNDPLQELYRVLVRAFPQCAKRGRPFCPHITLGQFQGKTPPDVAEFQRTWTPLQCRVTHVHMLARRAFDDPFHIHHALQLGVAHTESADKCVDFMYVGNDSAACTWRCGATGDVTHVVPIGGSVDLDS